MKGCCYYCEMPFSKGRVPGEFYDTRYIQRTRDHIIALDRGGNNSGKNIVPACEECNHLKANRLLEEFVFFLETRIECAQGNASSQQGFLYLKKLERMLKNTHRLIEKIKPYRETLLKLDLRIWDRPQVVHYIDDQRTLKPAPAPAKKEEVVQALQERLRYPPANKQQQCSQEEFLSGLRKRYPYVDELIAEISAALPGWIYEKKTPPGGSVLA